MCVPGSNLLRWKRPVAVAVAVEATCCSGCCSGGNLLQWLLQRKRPVAVVVVVEGTCCSGFSGRNLLQQLLETSFGGGCCSGSDLLQWLLWWKEPLAVAVAVEVTFGSDCCSGSDLLQCAGQHMVRCPIVGLAGSIARHLCSCSVPLLRCLSSTPKLTASGEREAARGFWEVLHGCFERCCMGGVSRGCAGVKRGCVGSVSRKAVWVACLARLCGWGVFLER